MTRRDPMHLTVCDRCYFPTWYETERPCTRSLAKRCPTCHQTTDGYAPCGGTLRLIDRSDLAPQFARYYESGERIRVRFAEGETVTGTVGKTTGWKPIYLLMTRSNAIGSPWIMRSDDVILAVKRGSKYVPVYA